MEVPKDRVIDGVDQPTFLQGKQSTSNREGFPFWLKNKLYGVKWHRFKLVLMKQKALTDPALPNPHLDQPRPMLQRNANLDYPYLHTWVCAYVGKILEDYQDSVIREPVIAAGAPLDSAPKVKPRRTA